VADGWPAKGSTGMMREERPRVLAIVAHTDDADISSGETIAPSASRRWPLSSLPYSSPQASISPSIWEGHRRVTSIGRVDSEDRICI